ncbi:MAG: immunoglobulin domain-containing protein, partial [Opitutaceae bacterium]|nr:immunoglobulin domain-containing protein [Opitutaceae bacterium]
MTFLILFQRLRWVYLPASLLSMILQRAPLVRVLVTAESALGGGVSALLRSAFTVAAVGSYHALAGATQLATSPATPASATAGQAFSMAFALTGAPSAAKSYEIKGTLPPGLSVPGMVGDLLNASTGTITGTPTTAGSYSLSIRAWSNTNKRGDGGTPTFTVQINVQGGAVAPPSFTAHPADASAVVGGSANFSASATGGTVTYQWRKDGGTLAGATAATLSLTGLTLASAGSYDVVATNAGGSTTSNAATLTVTQPAVAPSFTSQPASASANVGGSVSFTASASGTAPITYQWTKDGAPINGATSTTLTLNAVTLASAGSYQLTATNAAGSAQSNAAMLTVTQPAVAPSFTSQPANASATVGGTVTFTASASGTVPITYQWTKDGAPINGATSTTLTLNSVTLASAGSYRLTATNTAGSAQSNVASLTVSDAIVAPTFSSQPANATATVGGTATFTASANGTAPIAYQWTKDGAPITG